MKSNICRLNSKGAGMEEALREVEKAASYEELSKKETLQLRLLAEELTGIIRALTREFQAKFWIDADNKNFELNLEASAEFKRSEKEQLISMTRDGVNQPAQTVSGKIGRIFEEFLDGYEEVNEYSVQNGMVLPYSEGIQTTNAINNTMMSWSLDLYKRELVSKPEEDEHWDELEKSIVANLADDVIVSVGNKKAKITVYKRFYKRRTQAAEESGCICQYEEDTYADRKNQRRK